VTEEREALRHAYDAVAATFGARRNEKFDQFRNELLDWLACRALPNGASVLDLGSGPGYESVYLRERGIEPLALDFSASMIAECRKRGINGVVMDMYDLQMPAAYFAGALMSFSLLHMPKADVPSIIAKVERTLAPGAPLLVMLFEGEGEGPREQDRARFGTPRWFSYYKLGELSSLISARFRVEEHWRLDISPRPTIAIGARRRELICEKSLTSGAGHD
jgi:ubiquinone/menaquinone biosynthesis C-methylase UbiE